MSNPSGAAGCGADRDPGNSRETGIRAEETVVNQLLRSRTGAAGAPATGLRAVSALLADRTFQPTQPRSLEEAGLPESLVDALICKHLAVVGNDTGRAIADAL